MRGHTRNICRQWAHDQRLAESARHNNRRRTPTPERGRQWTRGRSASPGRIPWRGSGGAGRSYSPGRRFSPGRFRGNSPGRAGGWERPRSPGRGGARGYSPGRAGGGYERGNSPWRGAGGGGSKVCDLCGSPTHLKANCHYKASFFKFIDNLKADKMRKEGAGTPRSSGYAAAARDPSEQVREATPRAPTPAPRDPTPMRDNRDNTQVSESSQIIDHVYTPHSLNAITYEYLQNPHTHNPYYLSMNSITQNLDKAISGTLLYPTSFTPHAETYLVNLQNIKNSEIKDNSFRWKIVDSGASKNYDKDESFIINPRPHHTRVVGLNGASDFSCSTGTSCQRLLSSSGQLVPYNTMTTCLASTNVDLFSIPMLSLQGHKVVHDGDPINGSHGIKIRGPNGEKTKVWIPFTYCSSSGVWWIKVFYGTQTQIDNNRSKSVAEALRGENKRAPPIVIGNKRK